MQLVTRNGELVAILGATRFFLVPEIEDRDPHDRDQHRLPESARSEARPASRAARDAKGAAPVDGASRAGTTG